MNQRKFKEFGPIPELRERSRLPSKDCCGKGLEAEDSEGAASCCESVKVSGENDAGEGSCCAGGSRGRDWLFVGSALLIGLSIGLEWLWKPWFGQADWIGEFASHLSALILKMSWGLLLGILAVGLLSWVPRAWVARILGRGGSASGLLRATCAGLLLDLCNHGILMVASQLYKKGATLGQTVAFLIASPWNSLSMTIILFTLIGWKWTLAFIGLSMVIGLIAGWLMEVLVSRGVLPQNPHGALTADEAPGWGEVKQRFVTYRSEGGNWVWRMVREAVGESRMILRWIFFGAVLAAAIQTYVSTPALAHWFGPTWLGLALTLAATSVIEVCSEGSSPVAADLLGRASAPGNAFTFLMAGAATDYTELLVLRETTGRWKCALFVPLLTVPQILVIGYLLNQV